ncbi:MAG: PLP-dependent aminotransferase family protein [Desulfobacula sp.]|uniref:aminotransferase-like domain-containing protein n=1 Tax=Desulfobacula sp. TaxID=2593537 RepID=UPI0025BBD59F|nr:PLP-dependent aminotransferase family protein [Desulfobacula sp.]MCD4722681.1 PLP-dependent aminotransferase family protein [Desulfobacula sp.]
MIQIEINKKADKPLYVQIRDRLEQAIVDKELNPGDKLPSVAAFAKQVGVTQATIRRALEDLSKQGLTKCYVGRGTFIEDFDNKKSREKDFSDYQSRENLNGFRSAQARPELKFAAQQLRRGISEGLAELMNLAMQPDLISFGKGIPDPKLHEPGFLEALVKDALTEDQEKYIACIDCQGFIELREEIASRYENKGVHITPDQVLITNGSQQAASLVALDAAEKKQHVICEAPCFQGITQTFVTHGNWVDTIQRDEFGPVPEYLDYFTGESFLLYACPEFHNPTGTDMASERHEYLVRWAKKNKAVILSDEIFQDLRFEGSSLKSFYNTLGEEQTIIISSLSKSLMPGLRVGWMISSAGRIRTFTKLKRLMDHACPPLMQGIAVKLFQSGKYDEHLKRIQKIYLNRRNVMLECLKQQMPQGVTWTSPKGGFSLWVTLPEGYSSIALLLSAIDKGINFLPGPLFDIDQRFVKSFRLSWAWSDQDEIIEGIEILADTIKEFLRQPPGDSGLSGLGNFQ